MTGEECACAVCEWHFPNRTQRVFALAPPDSQLVNVICSENPHDVELMDSMRDKERRIVDHQHAIDPFLAKFAPPRIFGRLLLRFSSNFWAASKSRSAKFPKSMRRNAQVRSLGLRLGNVFGVRRMRCVVIVKAHSGILPTYM